VALRILLVDDHQILREGLKVLLEREGFDVVGEAGDGQEAVRLAGTLHPDVAIVDFSMPSLNGVNAARKIQQVSPATRNILLTMHTEDAYVLESIRAGIRAYVLKTQATADLVHAIHDVVRGQIYLSPGISRVLVDAYLGGTEQAADPLTIREQEVLQLVAEGKTAKEIAHLLGMSVKTAETHRSRIMEKLDIHDIAGLVRYAIRRGIIEP
jgi:DNA-binding NarL/FixJ family response regulator